MIVIDERETYFVLEYEGMISCILHLYFGPTDGLLLFTIITRSLVSLSYFWKRGDTIQLTFL